MRVRELAEWLGATYEGDGEQELEGPMNARFRECYHFLAG
jgi:hypothetical protein